ncbi:SWI/SNF complex subunit SWI3A [Arachis ipaensis]|uniref:SWI/SNF complex subunit SWI3A n=1 Tax=Arachis ipaensis TaxID=130454 RepID=UPI0007AEFE23|nr:SWI/SNF complex subunit SWI3A [Arachis ipaensis]
MELSKDPNSNPGRTEDSDSELELYTIPSSSRWFAWDEIHETERTTLREFFDGTSMSRSPKIYKEYRDFVINKYREDPTRKLLFTDVRKSLVGDVTLLRKVFTALEGWGLINYGATSGDTDAEGCGGGAEDEGWRVRVEEGAPNGIRVVATPNSLKPITLPRGAKTTKDGSGSGSGFSSDCVKLPPLASYSDVYGDLMKQKEEMNCGLCGDKIGSGHYRSTKDNFMICAKCFTNKNYGDNRSAEDFTLTESGENSGEQGAVWTEGETLLLLESVMKHGDNWDLVAQSVQTKSKLDCISKLIELPFGELMLGSAHRNGNSNSVNGYVNNVKQVQSSSSSSNHQETSKAQDQSHDLRNENEQNGDAVEESPSKRQRVAPLSDTSSSLLMQVGLIASVVDPHITAAAADAATMALCDENLCPREIFDVEEDYALSVNSANNSARAHGDEGVEMKSSNQSEIDDRGQKDGIPLTLRVRAAIATALGAAAARAKLLADQEDREVELLVATIIDAQVKKLQHKVRHFDDLELLMEKEHAEIEELKDSILTERIDVLRRTFRSGITRRKDYSYVKS